MSVLIDNDSGKVIEQKGSLIVQVIQDALMEMRKENIRRSMHKMKNEKPILIQK